MIRDVCTQQEFRDFHEEMENGGPMIGGECVCMGGTCEYNLDTGDWKVTLTNQVVPLEDNFGNVIDETRIGNWGGHTGSRCLTHNQQYLDEWLGEPSCGEYVANPFAGLPSPFAHELAHGGLDATEWGACVDENGDLIPFDNPPNNVEQPYGTYCRPGGGNECQNPAIEGGPQGGARGNMGAFYCGAEYSQWNEDFQANNGSGPDKNWSAFPGAQGACGNNSGYACAHMTACTVNGYAKNLDVDIKECICVYDGCNEKGDPRRDPSSGGLTVGATQNPDPPNKYENYPFPNSPVDPCTCVRWTIEYEGTSTPPTIDNCRCWTFELGGDKVGAGSIGPWCQTYPPGWPQYFKPRICFYAEGHPRGYGRSSTEGPNPPKNMYTESCCGCEYWCGCGTGADTNCGQAFPCPDEIPRGPLAPGEDALAECIGCNNAQIDTGFPTNCGPRGAGTEKFSCPPTNFDGDVCEPDDPGDPTGACCVAGGNCVIRTESSCTGEWQGPGSVCVPNPCGGDPPSTIITFPDGAPILGPGVRFGSGPNPPSPYDRQDDMSCRFICLDGTWYPLDDNCDKFKPPNKKGNDGEIVKMSVSLKEIDVEITKNDE